MSWVPIIPRSVSGTCNTLGKGKRLNKATEFHHQECVAKMKSVPEGCSVHPMYFRYFGKIHPICLEFKLQSCLSSPVANSKWKCFGNLLHKEPYEQWRKMSRAIRQKSAVCT